LHSRLRIGFVGLGGVVRRRHMPNLAAIDDVELAAVANRTSASTAAAARDFGIPKTFADWRDLVIWDGIDAVWIGTYPDTHRPITEAALAAGKHVFCQARMATSFADARAMVSAAERSDRTTILCPYSQYDRGDATIRRLIREGWLGRPTGVTITSLSERYADPDQPLHWRQQLATFGRNILDFGQLVEVQQRWLGPVRRVTALATLTYPTRIARETGQLSAVERPDTLTVAAELENGALATFVLSSVAHHAQALDGIVLYGTAGTIRYESEGDRILAGRAGDPDLRSVAVSPEDEPAENVEQRFIRGIREGRRFAGPPSFLDGLAYMEVIEAVDRSLELGQTITLPLHP
jgi:predicted dehydrogenase